MFKQSITPSADTLHHAGEPTVMEIMATSEQSVTPVVPHRFVIPEINWIMFDNYIPFE